MAAALSLAAVSLLAPSGWAEHIYGLPDLHSSPLGHCTGFAFLAETVDPWEDPETDPGGGWAGLYGNNAGWCVAYAIASQAGDGARTTHYLFGSVLTALDVAPASGSTSQVTCGTDGCQREGPKSGEFKGEWPDGIGTRLLWVTAWSRLDVFVQEFEETTTDVGKTFTCDPAGAAPPEEPISPLSELDQERSWVIVGVLATVAGAAIALAMFCFSDITVEKTIVKEEASAVNTPLGGDKVEVDLTGWLSVDFGLGDYMGLDTWTFYEDWVLHAPYDTGAHEIEVSAGRLIPGVDPTTTTGAGTLEYRSDLSPVVQVTHIKGTQHNWDWLGAQATARLGTNGDGTIDSVYLVEVDWEAPEPIASTCPASCPLSFESPQGHAKVALTGLAAGVSATIVESTLPPGTFSSMAGVVTADAVNAAGGDLGRAILESVLADPAREDEFSPRYDETYDYSSLFTLTGSATGAVTGNTAAAYDSTLTLIRFDLVPKLDTDSTTRNLENDA